MDSNATSPFVIIEFVGEVVNNKKQIELVPSSWLTNDEPPMCYYPPKKEYNTLDIMIKHELAPKTTWKKFKITILKFAKTFEKGQKKLEKAFRNINKETTDSEIECNVPSELSRSKVHEILGQTKSLHKTYIPEEIPISTNPQKKHAPNINPNSLLDPQASNIDNINHTSSAREEKKKLLQDQINDLYQKTENSETKLLMNFITATIELKTLTYMGKIEGLRRGYQYDMNKQTEKINNHLSSIHINNTRDVNPKSKFDCAFPIDTLDEFLKFEKSLDPTDESNANNPDAALERQEALKDIMQMEVGSLDKWEKTIPIILAFLIRKSVQLHYSGVGRVTKGVGKRNFSLTFTYKCLEEFLKTKYSLHGLDKTQLKISSKVGLFLSGAGDREGGAIERKKN